MHYRAGANSVNSKTHQLSLEITHMADEREMQGYTTAELQRETGFDRRTIAYYVHEGLLPKVGRRGSRTRYPKLVRDRLLFIRAVREAEQRGTVAPVSLRDLREIFQQAPPELISRVADGRTSVTPEVVAGTSPSFRPLARRRSAIEDRWGPVREDRTRFGSPRRLADSSFHEPRQADLESPEAHDWPGSAQRTKGTAGPRSTTDRMSRTSGSKLGIPNSAENRSSGNCWPHCRNPRTTAAIRRPQWTGGFKWRFLRKSHSRSGG